MARPDPERCQTLADAARAVATEFLQNVVIVDDEADLDGRDAGPAIAPQASDVPPEGAGTVADASSAAPLLPPGASTRGVSSLALTDPATRRSATGAADAGPADPAPADDPRDAPAGTAPAKPESGADTAPDPDPAHRLNAKALVDAFAMRGLICAVLRPSASQTVPAVSAAPTLAAPAAVTPGDPAPDTVPDMDGTAADATAEADASEAVRIATPAVHRADIVVLDWEINHDDGATACALLARILKDSDAGPGGRLRLVAFYTGAPNLAAVTARIEAVLRNVAGQVPVVAEPGAYEFTLGHVRVVVYAKPGSRSVAVPGARERIVAPTALPERLIADFAGLTTGLIPQVALASMAALRRQTHRLLARLGSDLDAAYLWQRAMQPRPADAEEHVVDIIAGELRAILDDSGVERWIGLKAIALWLGAQNRSGADNQAAFGETSPRSKADVLELLTYGANSEELRKPNGSGVNDRVILPTSGRLKLPTRGHATR